MSPAKKRKMASFVLWPNNSLVPRPVKPLWAIFFLTKPSLHTYVDTREQFNPAPLKSTEIKIGVQKKHKTCVYRLSKPAVHWDLKSGAICSTCSTPPPTHRLLQLPLEILMLPPEGFVLLSQGCDALHVRSLLCLLHLQTPTRLCNSQLRTSILARRSPFP